MALIIFFQIFSNEVHAKNELQLKFSDSVSIYSEKAYRRNNGSLFEAIGNVVIISGNDTLYGEKASLNSKTGDVVIEGSVRYISQNITLYGSRIHMNMITGKLDMTNTRMITPDFSIVASSIQKKSENIYYAKDAEFTTCRDCKESWLITGKEIHVEVNRYIQIYHSFFKIKGVDVLYLPYIAIPIKTTRESGLLFPRISSTRRNGNDEGINYAQPVYWAINKSSDLTFTPTFYGTRGYGSDLEYRQVFAEKKWTEFNTKTVMDKFYEPNSFSTPVSGTHYFRHFTEVETHLQFGHDTTMHAYIAGVKDLDFYRDFPIFSNERMNTTDVGADIFIDQRFDTFSMGIETSYKKNILARDTLKFDKTYVQVLPSVTASMAPTVLYQEDRSLLNKVTYGIDTRYTVFKQDNQTRGFERNVNRTELYPYLNVNLLNLGPVNLKSSLLLDYQEYDFHREEEEGFYKHATIAATEMSFTMDRIYGLAFEEEYKSSEFSEKDLLKFRDKDKKTIPIKKSEHLVGELPVFEDALAKQIVKIERSSYRHSQEYKFILYQILNDDEGGNETFVNQINTQEGWFDENDIIEADLQNIESNETRQTIPKSNTFEIQWNNSLIKKTPKKYSYLVDERYLKDTFSYQKIGYFNISQGLFLKDEKDDTANDSSDDFKDKLTRLLIDTKYNAKTWNFNLKDYYFHKEDDHILKVSAQKKFDRLSALGLYSLNSLETSNLETIKAGFQFKPHDVLGFSYLDEYDLNAQDKIRSVYQMDFMPNNNCWIINLTYQESFIDQSYSFNFVFNYGNEEFANYRDNYFDFNRLR